MLNKSITKISACLITLLLGALFAAVWLGYYNAFAFRSHREVGAVSSIVIWLGLYLVLTQIYRAFAIASSNLGDVIVSQLLCFGMADLALYAVACVSNRNYVNIWPGVGCVMAQLLVLSISAVVSKRVLMRHITPDPIVIIYGKSHTSESASFFASQLLKKYSHLFRISAIVPEDSGRTERLIDENARAVFIGVSYDRKMELARYCIDRGKSFYYVPEIEEILLQNCTDKHLLDTPLKRFDDGNFNGTYRAFKRVLDVLFAGVLLVLFSPVMLLAAASIKLEDGGPVFFRQKRVTRGEREFMILKFRSMIVDAEKYGVTPAVGEDPRITRAGKWLRRTRMDELPQLINILRGEMSFVGPRPERIEHVRRYEADLPQFRYRHWVKGGLTGYAQVYGKYNTSPEDKLKLDLMYILNQSFLLDLKLILLTARTVFQRESTDGFSEEDSAKMNEYCNV